MQVTVVGLIPARAGSKRLPNKNLLPLHGRTLIEHTCEQALHAGVCSAVYINTDSQEIADAAAHAGVSCPRLRPAELATDAATTRAATLFMLDELAKRGERFDALMILQPTSPLRSAQDIREAWQMFEENAPCAVVSVAPLVPSSWTGHIGRDGQFERQEGDDVLYRLNGAIYIYRWDDYIADRAPRKTVAYPMPLDRSIDIDTAADFELAEFLLSRGAYA